MAQIILPEQDNSTEDHFPFSCRDTGQCSVVLVTLLSLHLNLVTVTSAKWNEYVKCTDDICP